MALFKSPDNIIRRLEISDPLNGQADRGRYLDTKVPLRYGDTLAPAVKVYEQKYGNVGLVGWYALSASHTRTGNEWSQDADFINSIYWDGVQLRKSIATASIVNNRLTGVLVNKGWYHGRDANNSKATLGSIADNRYGGINPIPSNWFYNNIFFTLLKAGDDLTQTDLYLCFGPNGIIAKGLIDIIDNKDFDCLIVLQLRTETNAFGDEVRYNTDPEILVQYRRHPWIEDGAGGYSRVDPKLGNFMYEFLTNTQWGLSYPTSRIERSDFVDTGPLGGGIFYIGELSLLEFIQKIENESFDRRLIEQQGKIRFPTSNVTGLAITDDNIIGDIEIQYPDASIQPTKLIVEYKSMEWGTIQLVYGTDNTNVQTIVLETATTKNQAIALAENFWRKLGFSVTIKFKGDRSLQRFTINDTVSLATTVFSGTIQIVEMNLQDDYTFDITAEADITTVVPNFVLGDALPIIPVDGGLYRPKTNERPFDPNNPIEPKPIAPPTPPDQIEPPAPTFITIPNMNYPYNFTTGTNNTDWYLGSTDDGVSNNGIYDTNGCRTRFLRGANYGIYSTDVSLIYRPTDRELPTGILVAYDIGINDNEQANNLIGFTIYNGLYRGHYPGFLTSENDNFRYTTATRVDWRSLARGWWGYQSLNVIHGGGLDPNFPNNVEKEYVFTHGDNEAGLLRRTLITIDPTETRYSINIPTNLAATFGDLRQRKDDGSGNLFYRIHIAAHYGPPRSPSRVEYIGSTSTWGDGKSVLPADLAEAQNTARSLGLNWNYTYVNPPSRSVT